MKTTGLNDGVVVESWDDLSNISDDKLIKLRDVAGAYLQKTFKEYIEAREHSIAIQMELVGRGIVKPTN